MTECGMMMGTMGSSLYCVKCGGIAARVSALNNKCNACNIVFRFLILDL